MEKHSHGWYVFWIIVLLSNMRGCSSWYYQKDADITELQQKVQQLEQQISTHKHN